MSPAPDLNVLIATAATDAGSDDALAQLASASSLAAELAGTSDALVGHFVDRCRAAGHTWAEISTSLGVTRQAAHKRYSAIPRDLERWTVRAKQALESSVDAARGLGHAFVGTEHLLLGLFPPGGMAATLLQGWGLDEAGVATQVLERTPRRQDAPADPAFTPLAAAVLGSALTEAISLGHNYIGTEHLLLALFDQPDGRAAEILTAAGATRADAKAKVVEVLSGYVA